MLKFVVMSDLHIVPPGDVSHGLDTADRLRAAVRSVNENHADADFCILNGDLADRGETAAYEVLRDIVADLAVPCHIGLGNHDHRPTFLEVFGNAHIDANGFVQKVIDAAGYRVILVDSSEPERVDGVLCEARLVWLAARLEEAADRPVIIVLHHNVNALSMPSDRIKLSDADRFADVVKVHPDVRHVIAGHVHRATSSFWRGLPMTTISGGHYDVSAHVDGTPGRQKNLEGPGQYGVVLADADGVVVHFHDFLHRYLELPDALFPWRTKRDATAPIEG